MRTLLFLFVAASALAADAAGPRRLTLREAEELALKNHPAISAARFSAEASAEEPAQFAAARFPSVTGSLTGAGAPEGSRLAAGGLNNPVIYSRLATGFNVSQLLFDFGRTSRLIESSKYRARASDEEVKSARSRVVLEVDRAYFAALRSEAVVGVARETVEARQLVADQVAEFEKARLKSGLDRSFAEVSLAEAKLLLATAENQRRAAYAELTAALGERAPQRWELVEELFRIEPLSTTELIGKALSERPDLRALELGAEASSRFAAAEKALSYPAVSAIASTGWLPEHHTALKSRYGAAGINVNLPFLNGGLYKSRTTEANLRALAEKEKVKELETRIVRDVTLAVLQVESAAERVELSGHLLKQAGLAFDLAQSRYDLGLSSIVELSQAQLARTSAAIENVNARYDYQLQRAVLNYHIGQR